MDLPEIIAIKRKTNAINQLRAEQSRLATNNRGLDDEGYTKHRRELSREAGIKPQDQRFDREKFEEARALVSGLGRGGN
ncbi:hypothetical protein [Shouchella patagoniensis]|uniref:hypothetical protein n=1 Tax=Shouchella patagoniensis TaxID=228576 RepID=UPI0009952EE2|nr:hypothetical protein [Shouchella patagoniensis]